LAEAYLQQGVEDGGVAEGWTGEEFWGAPEIELHGGLVQDEGASSSCQTAEMRRSNVPNFTPVEGLGENSGAPEETADGGGETEGTEALSDREGVGDAGGEMQGSGNGVARAQHDPDDLEG
jgi:hypothetical protein